MINLPEVTQAQMDAFHAKISSTNSSENLANRKTTMSLLIMELERQALQHRDECRDLVVSHPNDETIIKEYIEASKFAENIVMMVFELTAQYSDTNLKAKTDNIKAFKEWSRQNNDR